MNSLRNYARLLADTPLIANIDVDMLPSASLSASLAGVGDAREGGEKEAGSEYVRGCNKEGKVYVIPAFETICGGPSYADRAASMDKASLHSVVKESCVSQFR